MQDDIPALADGDGVSIHHGFPNPALDRRGAAAPLALDLNRWLIKHTSSTYLFRVAGHRWARQGVFDGDVAVVDRALTPGPTDLIISHRDGDLNLCRHAQLIPEDTVWGVVTAIIHKYRP